MSIEVKSQNRALKRKETSGTVAQIAKSGTQNKHCLFDYLEGLETPVQLIKQSFTNEDGKTAVQYLIFSDRKLSIADITTNYQKRWRVEEYHKSLKQNVGLERSPTQTETTRTNHFFAALCGYVKLERLKIKTKQNHFALKSKLYLKALASAFQTLKRLNLTHLSA